jgi:hypothetical protein
VLIAIPQAASVYYILNLSRLCRLCTVNAFIVQHIPRDTQQYAWCSRKHIVRLRMRSYSGCAARGFAASTRSYQILPPTVSDARKATTPAVSSRLDQIKPGCEGVLDYAAACGSTSSTRLWTLRGSAARSGWRALARALRHHARYTLTARMCMQDLEQGCSFSRLLRVLTRTDPAGRPTIRLVTSDPCRLHCQCHNMIHTVPLAVEDLQNAKMSANLFCEIAVEVRSSLQPKASPMLSTQPVD